MNVYVTEDSRASSACSWRPIASV